MGFWPSSREGLALSYQRAFLQKKAKKWIDLIIQYVSRHALV